MPNILCSQQSSIFSLFLVLFGFFISFIHIQFNLSRNQLENIIIIAFLFVFLSYFFLQIDIFSENFASGAQCSSYL